MIANSPLDLIFRDLSYRLPGFRGEPRRIPEAGRVQHDRLDQGENRDRSCRGPRAPRSRQPGETILVESSSGNLGIALSLVCAVKGYEFVCVTDPNTNRATSRAWELYGAKVVVVKENATRSAAFSEATQEDRADRRRQPERRLAQPIRQHRQQERPRRADREPTRSRASSTRSIGCSWAPARRARLPGFGAASRGFPGVRIVAVEPRMRLRSVASRTSAPSPALAPACDQTRRPRQSGQGCLHQRGENRGACLAFARDVASALGGSTGAVLTAFQQMAPELLS